jgi:lipoate---protein ligase
MLSLKRVEWKVIPLTIADQQQHITQHERLIATLEAGAPAVLYWSQAEPEGLVLGFSQKLTDLNQAVLTQRPIPIYHRREGGTAVLVGPHLLGLDVVLPTGHRLLLEDIVESYRWFGEAWVETLRRMGVAAELVLPSEARAQRLLLQQTASRQSEAVLRRACYGAISAYEVVVGKHKVVGLDMLRRRVGSVLQAGLLLHWESETLADLLGQNPEEQAWLREMLNERAAGLDLLAGRVIDAREVISTFEGVLFS